MSVSDTEKDELISLTQEADSLRQRLEEERQKLNDVTCKYRT